MSIKIVSSLAAREDGGSTDLVERLAAVFLLPVQLGLLQGGVPDVALYLLAQRIVNAPWHGIVAVSYTHLTLPTIYSV